MGRDKASLGDRLIPRSPGRTGIVIDLTIGHVRKSDEPRLWLPDLVLGTYGHKRPEHGCDSPKQRHYRHTYRNNCKSIGSQSLAG